MGDITKEVFKALSTFVNEEKRLLLPRFFKTGKGEYGEGDKFIGVVVPDIRTVVKRFADLSMADIDRLLAGEWHEMRTCALFILVMQAERCQKTLARRQTPPAEKKAAEQEWGRLVDFYLAHSARINNWDLVDLSAPQVVGRYLIGRPRDVLYRLAESDLLWDNRIAIVSTYALIKVGELDDTYRLALQLLHHPHDLMHKAVGWMLREAGKRDRRRLYDFVETHRSEMPRTMLRYAIEHFDKETRKHLMRK